MNSGECWLCADGGAVSVLDWDTRDLRPGTFADWLAATRLIDSLGEISIYWNMVEGGIGEAPGGFVEYWMHLLRNCSKHIQDSVESVEKARLLTEILGIVFGERQSVKARRPFSYVLCPMSPLVIDSAYTDAYLETVGWDLPVAIMPMPLMGATAPASLISTMLVANADFLASLCLVQAATPGAPVIYAALPAAVEPHTWRYTGGGVENSLLSVAAADMGRHYGLPVEIGAGGTDHFFPGTQGCLERSLNWALPSVAWPDILVGPGLLGGSTILSLEQMLIDVETFRRCKHLRAGISTTEEDWLGEVLEKRGPGGSFIGDKSTLRALRDGGFYMSGMGFHDTYEKWRAAGMPDIGEEIPQLVREALARHEPLPLEQAAERELEALLQRTKSFRQ
jgi:trimethylamine--corrinoid protein Co-methyltransferase